MTDPARRLFDILVAGACLVLGSPVMGVVAVLVRLRLGSPVLFRQARSGLRGKEFAIIKFRTMRPMQRPGQPDRERETRLGAALRRTSLDELPQLVNILRGDMSLIGPRPTLPEQVRHYSPRQRGRLSVRPGLTGWAQVCGRNALSWPERIELDLWYIANRSWRTDLRIIWRTFGCLVRPRGVVGEGGVNPGFPHSPTTSLPDGAGTVEQGRHLYIVGAGGAGREALDVALAVGRTVTAFLDDGLAGTSVRGLPVLTPESVTGAGGADYVVAIGSASARQRLAALLDAGGLTPVTLVDPRAIIGPESVVGPGCIVQAGVVVSSNVTIGSHCQLYYNATVAHDCELGDYVTVLPGARVSGNVRLTSEVTVGTGAVIVQGLAAGPGALIGAGAVVVRDVPGGVVVFGSPAVPLPTLTRSASGAR